MPDILITSFGYLHGEPPTHHLNLDLRDHFRDPHVSPELRELTGADQAVVDAVLGTDGISEMIDGLLETVRGFWDGPSAAGKTTVVTLGCAGGRHRSYVVALELARLLRADGFDVELAHRDVHRPVVERDARGRHILPAPEPLTGTVVPRQAETGDAGLAGGLEHLAPAAAAALRLLADALNKKGADRHNVVESIKASGLAEAFAEVFEAASNAVMDENEQQGGDPYDFDVRLDADNLSAVASDIRSAVSKPWI